MVGIAPRARAAAKRETLIMLVGRHGLTGISILWLASIAGISCSPSTGSGGLGSNQGYGGGTGTGATPGTGTGGAPGVGGASTDPSSPGILDPGMTRNTHPNNADGSCAATSTSPEQVTVDKTVDVVTTEKAPLALYLMQDQSGSMLEPFILPPNKWSETKDAITAFVNDPGSAGIDIALQYFALNTAACDGSMYNVPEVPMGRLPGNASAIVNSLNAHNPSTGTPIEPALRGVTQYCATYNQQHPDEQCVAVFITDGAPSQCDGSTPTLTKIAADALANDKVTTFTIGMNGADFTILDAIAKAGGSDCTPNTPGSESCNVASGGTGFIDALNLIRKTVTKTTQVVTKVTQSTKLACEFKLPTPPDGAQFDKNQVNMQFTSATGVQKIYQVASLADCATTTTQAWYYDDPNTPTKLIVCPSTCTVLEAATGDGGVVQAGATPPRVDVLLGCATQVAPPA